MHRVIRRASPPDVIFLVRALGPAVANEACESADSTYLLARFVAHICEDPSAEVCGNNINHLARWYISNDVWISEEDPAQLGMYIFMPEGGLNGLLAPHPVEEGVSIVRMGSSGVYVFFDAETCEVTYWAWDR